MSRENEKELTHLINLGNSLGEEIRKLEPKFYKKQQIACDLLRQYNEVKKEKKVRERYWNRYMRSQEEAFEIFGELRSKKMKREELKSKIRELKIGLGIRP